MTGSVAAALDAAGPTVVGTLWMAVVLRLAWAARPHRQRRPLPGSEDGHRRHAAPTDKAWAPAVLRAAGRVVGRLEAALGRAALSLVGLHRPAAAPRLGRCLLAGGATTVALSPLVGGATFLALWFLPPAMARRHQVRWAGIVDAAVPELAELMLVAVGGGAGPRCAFEVASRWAPPALRSPVDTALAGLRAGRRLDEVLADLGAHSPALDRLAAAVGGAIDTGGPVATALAEVAADGRRVRRQQAQAAARRLPVTLLFPLTCCILPAFGLLTVGPALASGLRLLGP